MSPYVEGRLPTSTFFIRIWDSVSGLTKKDVCAPLGSHTCLGWCFSVHTTGFSSAILYSLSQLEHEGVTCTWKQIMGKFYYCVISTVRRHIKNPRTSHKQKFNFLLCDVLPFCSFAFRRWYHKIKIEGINNTEIFI